MNSEDLHNKIVPSFSTLIVRLIGITAVIWGLFYTVSSYFSARSIKSAYADIKIDDMDFNLDHFVTWWIVIGVVVAVSGILMIRFSNQLGRLMAKGITA